jgi:hypothetical protein
MTVWGIPPVTVMVKTATASNHTSPVPVPTQTNPKLETSQ